MIVDFRVLITERMSHGRIFNLENSFAWEKVWATSEER